MLGGTLKQISVGDGKVMGVNRHDEIYYRTGIDQSNPEGTGWKRIDGYLKYITVGDGKIMGVNGHNHIYYRVGISDANPEGTSWKRIAGYLKQISSSENNTQTKSIYVAYSLPNLSILHSPSQIL